MAANKYILLFKSLFLILIISFPVSAASKEEIRRFAFIAGVNNGGAKREKLLYAVSDAVSFQKLLHEMGGVLPGDSILMLNPDREKFLSGIRALQRKIKVNKHNASRIEAIFYYSGHSDEQAILLGNEKIKYEDIKKSINSFNADVKIAIFDSCSSGAFTRLKGGKMRTPFMIDNSYNMKGYAFMTSSSIDEASQESDSIKGSFFTHYLLSGLRGAADMTQDGRITLNEAYQFAYNETLARTEKTLSGPQHPNYNIQMSGTGDVVMTDIRKSRVVMTLDKDLSGKFFIRDMENNLVCELRKPASRQIQFGLEDGTYTITNIEENGLYEARIVLATGSVFTLARNHFTLTDKEYAVVRGDTKDAQNTEEQYITKIWELSLYPDMRNDKNTIHKYLFNLAGSYSAKLDGISLGFGPGIVRKDVRGFQIDLAGNYAKGGVEGAQLLSLGNYSGGNVSGGQLYSLFCISRGELKGVQLSALFNYTSLDTMGFQYAALFNIGQKNMTGYQFTGIFNFSGNEMTGCQTSGVFNYTGKDMKGLQLSGIANIAGNSTGSQISLVNIADNFKGIQIGLVNIADEQNGIPIGLINISDNGGVELAVWASNLMACNTGLVFRSNYIYTIFSAGWMNLDNEVNDSYSGAFYLGGHIPLGHVSADIDVGYAYIDNKKLFSNDHTNDQTALQVRLSIEYSIFKRLSVFAGVGSSYIYPIENEKSKIEEGHFSPYYFAGTKVLLFGQGT
ncbi:MAG: caspase family protein [Spirochaetes bacterium]|nr:caspase family protein [Spirochaetota bacterium]